MEDPISSILAEIAGHSRSLLLRLREPRRLRRREHRFLGSNLHRYLTCMSAPAPNPEPSPLDYQSARAHETRFAYVSMSVLLGATLLFAASHWTTEYACQSLYHLRGVQPGTFAYVRALELRDNDMMIETFYIAVCSAAFLIVQGLLRPSATARVRPHAWLAAIAAGLVFCLARWAIWLAVGHSLPGAADFCLAVLLAIALATGVSLYRWPRGRAFCGS
jgi:hypothetical protein